MNTSHYLRSMLLASVLALGAGVAARADDGLPGDKAAPVTDSPGLLGQVYGTLTYSYINLDDTSTHADNYSFSANQPLAFGLDGVLSYDFSQSGEIAGSRVRMHTLGAGLRAFSTSYNWGKPYVEAGGGFAWSTYAGNRDNSVVWLVATGVELQVTPVATVTPYVRYMDAPDLGGNGSWNFGAKANHWVNSRWAVTAGFEFDNDRNTTFTVGTNFRF